MAPVLVRNGWDALVFGGAGSALLDGSLPKGERWRWSLERTACELKVRLGQMEGMEEKAGELLAVVEDELDRLAGHMLLGRYYLAAGEGEKSRSLLEYVLEHGGEHHFRRDAERLMGKHFP